MAHPIGHIGFDTYFNRLGELITGLRVIPAWTPDGEAVAFTTGGPDDRQAWRVSLADGAREPLVDIAKARHAIEQALGFTPPGRGLPFEHFAYAGPSTIAFQVGADSLTLDLESLTAVKAPAPDMVEELMQISAAFRATPQQYRRTQPLIDLQPATELTSPDGRFHLSTDPYDLVLRSTQDGRTVRFTDDGHEDVHWRFDWTNPMLAMLGMDTPTTCWSPDGNRIAAYRVDNAGVAKVPQVHYLKRTDEVVWRHHTKAGGVLERADLFLFDVYDRPPVRIDLGDTTDTYPVFAGWLPDASAVIVLQFNRLLTRVDAYLADAATGAVTPMFSEEADTFLRIHHDIYFGRKVGLDLTPDGQHLIWESARDGFKHLYLYDLDGTLVRQLTAGDWPVDRVRQITADGTVLFTAHHDPDQPCDLHVCSVPLEGGEVTRLTGEPGVHTFIAAPAGTAFLDTHSIPDQPPVTVLRGMDGQVRAELVRADISQLQAGVGWTAPEQFTVTAADGETDLWGVMYKPADFDPARTYPVIEYVYGGPQIAVATHGFASHEAPFAKQAQALAQLGYITVVLDARGTPGRSKAFHDVVHGSWAAHLADDHAEAIRQLAERHDYIDGDRVGVIGHSWGGYTTFRLLADRPDVYKVGVSSAPGFDPFSSVLYEAYLGLPQTDLAAYHAAQTLTLAPKVEGRFMIACGTSDHATWTDAIKMSEALIRAGRDHEFVVMPAQYHGYDHTHDTYFLRKATGLFAEVLQP